MTVDDLDQLLLDRFNLHRSDLIAALKTLPANRPWAAALTATQARLLDDADLAEDDAAYAEIATDATTQMARLYSTAYSAAEVRAGLGVQDSRVRQRRLAHTLWAIDDGGRWVYPAIQFVTADPARGETRPLKQVRGLSEVLPALLATGVHPIAIVGFLLTPQPELSIDGQPSSVRDWLLHGGAVGRVHELIEIGDWATA